MVGVVVKSGSATGAASRNKAQDFKGRTAAVYSYHLYPSYLLRHLGTTPICTRSIACMENCGGPLPKDSAQTVADDVDLTHNSTPI